MSRKRDSRPQTGSSSGGSALPAWIYGAVGLTFAVLGFGAVYVSLAPADNRKGAAAVVQAPSKVSAPAAAPVAGSSPAAQPGSGPLPTGPGTNPLSVGQMATFVFKKAPEDLPKVSFVDAAGKERSLAEWKGKVVLLNLWATWCAPCRKEMPGIDRLKAELGSADFDVVAVSVDRTGIAGAKKFLEQIKVERLEVLSDPSARMSATLRAIGMPATLLIDREGREIGRLVGPAEWDSEEAKRLIRAAIAGGAR